MTTIKSLITDYTNKPEAKAIRFLSKDIPTNKGATGHVIAPAFQVKSNDAVILNMHDYGNGANHTTLLFEDGTQSAHYLPGDLEVTLLEGEDQKKLMALWKKKMMDTLHTQLGHSGQVNVEAEFFIENEKGECVPSFLFITEGASIARAGGYSAGVGNMYARSFATSFKTASQSACLAWGIDSISAGLKGIHEAANTKFPGSKISLSPVKEFSADILAATEAKYLKVDDNYHNAYGLKVNRPAEKETARSARSSIHLAFNIGKLTDKTAEPIVKALDAVLGVPCVSLLAGMDNTDRSKVGGLPGDYRIPSVGLEYCALSNAWMCHPMITNLVLDYSRKAIMFGQKGLASTWDASEEEVIACMLNQDVDLARKILARNKDLMMKLFKAAYYFSDADMETLYTVFYEGAARAVKNPLDVATNWNINGTWQGHSDGTNKNVYRSVTDLTANKEFRIA